MRYDAVGTMVGCENGSLKMKALLEALAPGSEDLALARALDAGRIPAHIAIIMDGNGRWAQQRNLPRVVGHKAGVAAVRATVETCAQLGVGALTLYAFSVENWKRPRLEVETLWRLLRVYLHSELDLMMRHDIRFSAFGRLEALPAHVRAELEDVTGRTAGNRGLRLNLAINYGGRAELVDAVKALVKEVREDDVEITEQAISAHLYTAGLPDPDLLIRTSGEMRISNFLLWQIAYAELYVTETLWPDFTRAELLRAIVDYQKRDRRYGGLGSSNVSASDAPEMVLEPVSLPAR
jgi:undecaprenyl diphosphate synthase